MVQTENRRVQKLLPLVVMLISTLASATKAADHTTFTSGEEATSVIELFTSEGCSSCPAADRWISRLKTNSDLWKNIVPAVFHVDYWDGLGWPDRFAKAEYTRRQRAYASSWPTGAVYTPAFVVNGKEWLGFSSSKPLPKARAEKVGVLTIAIDNEREATAMFVPIGSIRGPLILELVLLGTNLQSDVRRGENSGRKLHHDFVVLHIVKFDMASAGNRWTGSVSLPINGETKPTALAAWVRTDETAPAIQATGGWLSPGPH